MSRVLLLFENLENRRLLRELLALHYDVAVATEGEGLAETFDLCVLDGPKLERWTEAIVRRKAAEHPLFLPFLLVTPSKDLGLASRHLWKAVDELLVLPIQKVELQARIKTMLRARDQSLALKRLHEEREQAVTAELEAARSLARLKSNFVNSVSHELRTPLTTIMGYAEFLEDRVAGPLSPAQLGFIAQIEQAASRLDRHVGDLLDYARMDAGTFKIQPESGDLKDVIEEVIMSLQPQLKENRQWVDVETPPGPLALVMDRRRIAQVLSNLLTNAMKFTPAGEGLVVRARRDGAALRCEVRDRGEGIPAEAIPFLFQPFCQLPSGIQKGGTGLGLSISKAIVEAHCGAIGVESQPGSGSCFWFTLPLPAPSDDGSMPAKRPL